jgi:hypothetical protein
VIDLRGATAGVPESARFYPAVPADTGIPSRGFGFDLGGHVYLFQFGPARIGVGVDLYRLRGTASPAPPTDDDDDDEDDDEDDDDSSGSSSSASAAGAPEFPDITATITTIAPQVSVNFGGRSGWSYLSAGLGRAHVTTARSAFEEGTAETRESGSVTSQNFGGGARWFTSDHMAFSFDIRFHLLSPGVGQPIAGKPGELTPGTPRTRIVTASVGISVR